MNNTFAIGLVIVFFVAMGTLVVQISDHMPDLSTIIQSQTSISPSLMKDIPATVKRVVDGDTIELASGEKVRYIGIDTPEKNSPTVSKQCFAEESSVYNQSAVEGKNVKLTQDTSARDRYGRLLAYVYLEDGTFLNADLVKKGFAFASEYPPDTAKQAVLDQAQETARSQGLGLWKQCEILIDKNGRYHTNVLIPANS